MCYPNTGSFKYEFHKGNPWKHETLIAPFDFPIYKTDKDITEEKLEILKDYKPYFIYNDTIGDSHISNFTTAYLAKWNNFILLSHNNRDSIELTKLKYSSLNTCKSLFKQIYERGILNNDINDNSIEEISIIKNRIAETIQLETVFTPVSAYNYFLDTSKEKIKNKSILAFIKKLNLNSFLYPNLTFNKEKSEQFKEQLLENVSLTKGIIQSGERIIMKGDIIDNGKYQILTSLKTEYEKFIGDSGKTTDFTW